MLSVSISIALIYYITTQRVKPCRVNERSPTASVCVESSNRSFFVARQEEIRLFKKKNPSMFNDVPVLERSITCNWICTPGVRVPVLSSVSEDVKEKKTTKSPAESQLSRSCYFIYICT